MNAPQPRTPIPANDPAVEEALDRLSLGLQRVLLRIVEHERRAQESAAHDPPTNKNAETGTPSLAPVSVEVSSISAHPGPGGECCA